jgi:dihydroneopterin aldolase
MIIDLKNIPIIASVGIYENERKNPTKIIVSVVINYSFSKNSVVDYDLILQQINEIAKSKHFEYIEEMAEEICSKIKNHYPQIHSIKTKIQKCILRNIAEEISVECEI